MPVAENDIEAIENLFVDRIAEPLKAFDCRVSRGAIADMNSASTSTKCVVKYLGSDPYFRTYNSAINKAVVAIAIEVKSLRDPSPTGAIATQIKKLMADFSPNEFGRILSLSDEIKISDRKSDEKILVHILQVEFMTRG